MQKYYHHVQIFLRGGRITDNLRESLNGICLKIQHLKSRGGRSADSKRNFTKEGMENAG